MSLEFQEYFNRVCAILLNKGYERTPDRDIVEANYAEDISVEKCAEEFVDDWGDPGDEEID